MNSWWLQRRYLRELLLLQILGDVRVEVLGVAFVQTEDLASLLDPHISVDQDELTDRLDRHTDIKAVSRTFI